MMYDISVKNFNGIEVFHGQNLTEELTKMIIDKYSNLPNVCIWKSPDDCSDCLWKQVSQQDLDESEDSE